MSRESLFDDREQRDLMIRQLRDEGLSLRAIADRVGVSKGVVNRVLYGHTHRVSKDPWCPACRCAHDSTQTPCVGDRETE